MTPQRVRARSAAPNYLGRRRVKLTMNRIAELQCPAEKKDMLVFDDEQRGLVVRVSANGSKSYLAQYTFAGSKRRVPLGSVSALSLKAAREAVQAIQGEVAKGHDPADERKSAAQEARRKALEDALTLDRLLEDWKSLHLADKREGYANEALRAVRRAFEKSRKLPAADLTRAVVVHALDAITREGSSAMASATRRYGAACYSWATKRGTVEVNPFANLPTVSTTKRDRVLTDDELIALWRATAEGGPFNAIVRTLLLTGQRREEVAGLTRDELSTDFATWTLPAARAKNGQDHIVPLSEAVRAIVRAAPEWKDSRLVFRGRGGVFAGFSKAKDELDTRMLKHLVMLAAERGEEKPEALKPWRLHDLRRTLATGLQCLGVRLETTEAVLNHVSGSRAGIVGVYQRHDFSAEKRVALDAWAEHVAAVVDGRKVKENIIELRRPA